MQHKKKTTGRFSQPGKFQVKQRRPDTPLKSSKGARRGIRRHQVSWFCYPVKRVVQFLAKCDFLDRAAHQLALEDSASWTAAQEQLKPMQETFERIYGDAKMQLGVATPSPETGGITPGAAKVRARHDLKLKPSQATGRCQAKNPCPNNSSPKKEKAEAFFRGKCRLCGSTVHALKDCKVSPDVKCRNCNKAGHLAKICASHIFSPLSAEQQQRRKMVANMIEQGENSSDKEAEQASALAVSRRVRNASPVYRC